MLIQKERRKKQTPDRLPTVPSERRRTRNNDIELDELPSGQNQIQKGAEIGGIKFERSTAVVDRS